MKTNSLTKQNTKIQNITSLKIIRKTSNSIMSTIKPNKKSDIYSVGVLLWELTSGKPPFSDLNISRNTLMFSISEGTREKPIPNTPDEYINLYKGKIYIYIYKIFI